MYIFNVIFVYLSLIVVNRGLSDYRDPVSGQKMYLPIRNKSLSLTFVQKEGCSYLVITKIAQCNNFTIKISILLFEIVEVKN